MKSYILIILFLFPKFSISQNILPNNLELGFNKNVNTHRWDGSLYYSNSFSKLQFLIDERFKSTLIKTNRSLIRDEQYLDLFGKYSIGKKTRTGIKFSSFIISDNQTVEIGQVASNSFHGGFEFQPINELFIEPYFGLKIDRQLNETDAGLSLLLNTRSNNLVLSGFNTNIDASFQRDYLNPRRLESINALIFIQKSFFDNTQNSLSILYKKNRREFYFPADSASKYKFNIDKRIENLISIHDTITYKIGTGLQLNLNGTFSMRKIEKLTHYKTFASKFFDNNINEFKIEGSSQLLFNLSKIFSGTIQIYYAERDMLHSLKTTSETESWILPIWVKEEEKKNNNSKRTSISTSLALNVSHSDKIVFLGSGNLLRYDTPSLFNDDDRDELWIAFDLTTYHYLNKYLFLQNSLSTNLTHVVYLLGSRSASNNWNRLFRLSPLLRYKPSEYFSTTNSFEVLANYTVFDFADKFVNIKSFSFRQFSFIDSTHIKLTPKIGLSWFNHIRFYERGELNWKYFKGKPLNYFEDYNYITKLHYQANENLLFSVGIYYFKQNRYLYKKRNKHLENYLQSSGPISTITWNYNSKIQMHINGSHERILINGSQTNTTSNMNMTLKLFL